MIDGQQRLTTIYLILYYFNQRVIEEDREEIFSIDYETRQSSHEFLQDLKRDSINSDNIDFYYIWKCSLSLLLIDSKMRT